MTYFGLLFLTRNSVTNVIKKVLFNFNNSISRDLKKNQVDKIFKFHHVIFFTFLFYKSFLITEKIFKHNSVFLHIR